MAEMKSAGVLKRKSILNGGGSVGWKTIKGKPK